jgi:hypothetical protein
MRSIREMSGSRFYFPEEMFHDELPKMQVPGGSYRKEGFRFFSGTVKYWEYDLIKGIRRKELYHSEKLREGNRAGYNDLHDAR